MRKYLLFIGLFMSSGFAQAQVAITNDGSTPDPSAMLDIKSTNRGVLFPRLTTLQRTSIPAAINGLMVFDTETASFWYKHPSGWVEVLTPLSNVWAVNGNHIYNTNSSNVGIGTNNPSLKLDVSSTIGHIARFNGGTGSYVSIYENGTYRGYFGSFAGSAEDVDLGTGSGNAGKLHLTIQASPRLTIDNAGRVGIGTTAPSSLALLDVNGKIRSDDFSGSGVQNVQVDNNGVFTAAPVVGFEAKVTNLSGISIAPNVEELVNFSTTDLNDGNGFSTVNDRFTAPSAGLYHFDLRINWLQFSSNGMIEVEIKKNGSLTASATSVDAGSTVVSSFDTKYSFNLKLNAGDYLQVYITQRSSGNQSYRQAIFEGFRVY